MNYLYYILFTDIEECKLFFNWHWSIFLGVLSNFVDIGSLLSKFNSAPDLQRQIFIAIEAESKSSDSLTLIFKTRFQFPTKCLFYSHYYSIFGIIIFRIYFHMGKKNH